MKLRLLGTIVAATLVTTALIGVGPTITSDAAPAPVLDLARPRIVAAGTGLALIRARLDREPYATIFRQLDARAHQADAVPLDDHTIGSERTKAKATKDLAFEYRLDRTVGSGAIGPFPSPTARTAVGDVVRDRLLAMYTRSRLAVPAPLGGGDRDINTSEELLQYASAYDTMLAAGYDFGPAGPIIRANLTDLASELYRNYVDPATASNSAAFLPNNHRSKSAAALAVAALALFDTTPTEGASTVDSRDPRNWLIFGLDQVDLIQRFTFVAPGGGYGEGPYYQRYASQNLLPFTRAWDHARGNRAWNVGGRSIPDLWQHPAYRATQRWMLDVTLPDGGLAPIDDGNVGFSYYFGLAPTDPADAASFRWRWEHAPTPYDTDGSIDLAADALANFDDSISAAPPTGSPTRLDDESGTAVFRSDWNPDAVEAVVLGEHGAAMELGRDRNGLGQVAGAAHEHPDTASYLLHAYGERLLLDPGYLTFEQRGLVNKPTDHNEILVNGSGPSDPFIASIIWTNNRAGLPPVDGEATMTALADSAAWDRTQVDSAYAGATIRRRFEFVDNRYLVTFDTVNARVGDAITWVTHGNGGGTSGGTFSPATVGGRWEHGAARVDTGLATSAGAAALAIRVTTHEGSNRALLTHTTLDATATAVAPTTRAVGIAYPTRIGDAPPVLESLPHPDDSSVRLRLTDVAGDRIVTATQSAAGHVTVRDRHLDGRLRSVSRDSARTVSAPSGVRVTRTRRGILGVQIGDGTVAVVAPKTDVGLHGLAFVPARTDGACSLTTNETGTYVRTPRDGAVTLFASAGNSAPAADPGPDVDNVPAPAFYRLDASASCDANRDALTAHWQVLAAPAGSAWILVASDTTRPWLAVDVPGPYRIRLTVTDSHGASSRASDLTVFAGPRCIGDRLTWSDPRC